MSATSRTIELDADTAAIVERRSAEYGVSVSEFIAELVAREDDPAATDSTVDTGEIAELDRRWEAIQQGQPTVDHADVCRWLETWGTADFKPWPGRR